MNSKNKEAKRHKVAKAELSQRISEQTGLTRSEAGEVVSALTRLTVQALQQGRTVGLMGLGTLSITHTKERRGVRPGTTESITIPAGKKVRFKPSTSLKQDLQDQA